VTNRDFRDLFSAFVAFEVRLLVVGDASLVQT
jgi:hypothetical protein